MNLRRKPKLIGALLVGGTLALIGGGAFAATLPTPGKSMMMKVMAAEGKTSASVSVPPVAARSSAVPVAPTTVPSGSLRAPRTLAPMGHKAATMSPAKAGAAKRPPVTYVVHRGDTLSGIAAWFKLHGYGELYAANMAVVGSNPNLILPGERITIAGGVLTMAPPK